MFHPREADNDRQVETMGGLATTAKLRRCSIGELSNVADSISGLPKGGLFNGNCQDFMQKKRVHHASA